MKKIVIALMSLSLLTGTVAFAQNSSTDTMKKKTKKKKKKGSDTMAK
jgi:Ni/Co efflux regulator RcnB